MIKHKACARVPFEANKVSSVPTRHIDVPPGRIPHSDSTFTKRTTAISHIHFGNRISHTHIHSFDTLDVFEDYVSHIYPVVLEVASLNATASKKGVVQSDIAEGNIANALPLHASNIGAMAWEKGISNAVEARSG